MTIAEIRGKISDANFNLSERMEDLLTSDTFGCFRYLPPETLLLPFLSRARSFGGNLLALPETINKVHFAFWPTINNPHCNPCEPDALIILETKDHSLHVIMVEAKYYSGISSEEDENPHPNNQLAREFDNLSRISPSDFGYTASYSFDSRFLLFVTQDMALPFGLIEQSLSEYRSKRKKEGDIYWLSWRCLVDVIEKNLEYEATEHHRAIMEDMSRLLLRKELILFSGVDPIMAEFRVEDFEFYASNASVYDWPKIPVLNFDYEYRRSKNG